MDAQASCRLLSLPTELRLKTYEYALTSADKAIRITQGRGPNPPPWMKSQPAVNLLRTCRQIYHEAVDIFYERNTIFVFCDLQDRSQPIISEKAIPASALVRIRLLFIVLWAVPLYELGDISSSPEHIFRHVGMQPFACLSRLRQLRVSLLSRYPINDQLYFKAQAKLCGDVLLGLCRMGSKPLQDRIRREQRR